MTRLRIADADFRPAILGLHKKGVNLISRSGEFVHNWQLALTIAIYIFAYSPAEAMAIIAGRSGHHLTRSTYTCMASRSPFAFLHLPIGSQYLPDGCVSSDVVFCDHFSKSANKKNCQNY